MPFIELTLGQQKALLKLARASIELGSSPSPEQQSGLTHTARSEFPELTSVYACCFVSLHCERALRGCIGALKPYQDLLSDIVEHANAAAYRDARFPPLSPADYGKVQLSISVLSEAEQMTVADEADLLAQLRPGIDGLTLELNSAEGRSYRSTFLPVVWQQLPEPHDFVVALKQKAGLAGNFWSKDLAFSRYTTNNFEEAHHNYQ